MPRIDFMLYDDETGECTTVSLPAVWEDCWDCYGSGKTLAGGLRGIVFTYEDRCEDPEFFEDMARGLYDAPCPSCKGSGARKTYDYENIDEEMRARVLADEEERAAHARMQAAERRFCGEWD